MTAYAELYCCYRAEGNVLGVNQPRLLQGPSCNCPEVSNHTCAWPRRVLMLCSTVEQRTLNAMTTVCCAPGRWVLILLPHQPVTGVPLLTSVPGPMSASAWPTRPPPMIVKACKRCSQGQFHNFCLCRLVRGCSTCTCCAIAVAEQVWLAALELLSESILL